MRHRRNLALILTFIPTTMLLSSCGRSPDLDKVAKFSELSDAAAEKFANLAADVYASCIRAAEYQPILLESDHPFERRQSALETCEQEPRQVEVQLIETHSVVVTYLKGLGQLASKGTVDLSGLNAIQESFKGLPTRQPNENIPALTANQIQAGSGILSIVSEVVQAAVEQARLKKVQFIIVQGDDSLQTLTEGFTTIIERGYLPYLKDEETAIDEYYDIYTGGVIRNRSNSDDMMSLTNFMKEQDSDWRDARNAVTLRQKAAQDYLDLIQGIAATHHNLKEKFKQGKTPTTAELNQLIDQYTVRLEDLTQELKIAYRE